MLAVELHPEAGEARRYCEALQGSGILAKDTHGHTIRIAPPLVITAIRSTGRWSRSAALCDTISRDFEQRTHVRSTYNLLSSAA